jgi:CDP-paratose 2-epimerase
MVNALVTGGAGFIGSNLAYHLLARGYSVMVYDNLSRAGARANVDWLKEQGKNKLTVVQADVRDFEELREAAEGCKEIYHLAGQVAVTASVENPRNDFENNALGTLNALEAARLSKENPIFFYASTNKVYGSLSDEKIVELRARYELPRLKNGIGEKQPLDFHSPYGCSKGAGDQYVRDFSRIYGLRTIVFRQSCIYGQRQFGVEDQGWLAWFMLAALRGEPITIYGDGKQVRDILHIDDLLEAVQMAVHNISVTAGQVYNIGGGPKNAISVWAEFAPMLQQLLGRGIKVEYAPARPGDQQFYVSDITKARADFSWEPRTGVKEGLGRLFDWAKSISAGKAGAA